MKAMITKHRQFFVISLAFVLIESIGLFRPPTDAHQWRQTHTLSIVDNFLLHGMNLFLPEIDSNLAKPNVLLEFPLYQWIAAALSISRDNELLVSRLISIASVLASAWILYRLSSRVLPLAGSLVGVCAFLFNPSAIFWGAVPLIDYFALALALVAMYVLLDSKNRSWWILFLAGSLLGIAFAVKLPTALAALLACAAFALTHREAFRFVKLPSIAQLAIGAIGVYGLWYLWSRSINSANPHAYTANDPAWLFGTLSQWSDPIVYQSLLTRLFTNFNLGLIALLIAAVWVKKMLDGNRVALGPIIAQFLGIGVYLVAFINLNFVHTYYQIPLSVFVFFIASIELTPLAVRMKFQIPHISLLVTVAIFWALVTSTVLAQTWSDPGRVGSPYQENNCEYQIAENIRDLLPVDYSKSDMTGVLIEPDAKCWTSPHSMLYFIRGRGFATGDPKNADVSQMNLKYLITVEAQNGRRIDAKITRGFAVMRKFVQVNGQDHLVVTLLKQESS